MQSKNTILKAIHNELLFAQLLLLLRMQSKNTILKAIHNKNMNKVSDKFTANAK